MHPVGFGRTSPLDPSKRSYAQSSSFKMAVFFTVLLGTSVCILAYFINQFNQDDLIREVENSIDSEIAAFRDWFNADAGLSPSEIIQRLDQSHRQSWYLYYNGAGTPLYGTIHAYDRSLSTLSEGILTFSIDSTDVVDSDEISGEIRVAAKMHTLPDGGYLMVVRDIEAALQSSQKMRILGVVTIVLMLAVIATSFFISSYVVGLTNRIAGTAWQIIHTGDLSRRIESFSRWDDLGNLAAILNEMLARIEDSVEGVKQVSDNIAHDLRTPLSRLRNNVEALQRRLVHTNDARLQRKADELIAEVDHILNTFNALLRIANIESGKRQAAFAAVDLKELLEDVIELYQPIAEEKNVVIKGHIQGGTMMADQNMMFQVVANLIDNAIKFSPQDANIRLIQTADNGIQISVEDEGPGVSDDEKTKIFNRFFRAENCRSSPGNGLGLSLVSAVVKLHKGRIQVADNSPGLIVGLFFD